MSVEPSAQGPALELVPETPADAGAIERLLDHAFGPGRFVKVSERVREMADFAPEMSVCAWQDGALLGSVRMWRVAVDGRPVMFLGPLAVEAEARKHGVGGLLVERACELARAAGERAVLLVGDLAYFARVGFEGAPHVTLPGPVDPKRVLVRRFADIEVAGAVSAR